MSTNSKRIIFTGGSGLAGQHCIQYLLNEGHSVLNLDIQPLDLPGVHTLITDLTNAGEVYSALSHNLFRLGDYFKTPLQFPSIDAVIHFAAFPRPLIVPDNRTFHDNVMTNFNVIEAACKLGIRKVVIASSQSIYGAAYSHGNAKWKEFPILEDTHPCHTTDVYGLAKVCAEKTAESFAERFGVDVYALRPGHVIVPGSYTTVTPTYLDDLHIGKKVAWSYTDARDLGQLCHRCVVTDGLGWQTFNAVNDRALCRVPIMDAIRDTCPEVQMARELRADEAPTSNEKAKKLLGFQPQYDWKFELEREARTSGSA